MYGSRANSLPSFGDCANLNPPPSVRTTFPLSTARCRFSTTVLPPKTPDSWLSSFSDMRKSLIHPPSGDEYTPFEAAAFNNCDGILRLTVMTDQVMTPHWRRSVSCPSARRRTARRDRPAVDFWTWNLVKRLPLFLQCKMSLLAHRVISRQRSNRSLLGV